MTFSWDKFSERASDWLFKQGASTVLLSAILGWMGWFGHYAINTAIPSHILQMQAGYEKEHDRFDQNLERIISVIERAGERSSAKATTSTRNTDGE